MPVFTSRTAGDVENGQSFGGLEGALWRGRVGFGRQTWRLGCRVWEGRRRGRCLQRWVQVGRTIDMPGVQGSLRVRGGGFSSTGVRVGAGGRRLGLGGDGRILAFQMERGAFHLVELGGVACWFAPGMGLALWEMGSARGGSAVCCCFTLLSTTTGRARVPWWWWRGGG